MTDNSKTPSAKKTIQDPPEYAAVNKLKGHEDQATYQQNGQQAVTPSEARVSVTGFGGGSESAASSTPKESDDWLGGPQNGEEDDRGRVPADDIKEKKAPKGSLSGGVDAQEGGGPDV
ncbi:hypothetical protein ACCS92_02375 [Rhizobium ruizarguesonis]|uniref:hypothetical protein n=1 Tax=Rhizobium ruizarguesonis TaxID=2081791 RepID=UPI0013EE962C|nr:hypothetical protein [Rhizobium ruizarguesonis]